MYEETTSTADTIPLAGPPAWLRFGNATHRGQVRQVNEDDHGFAPDLGFFVVADGVGGLPGGAMAARLATLGMVYALRSAKTETDTPAAAAEATRSPLESHGPRLVAAAHQAHQLVRDHAARADCRGASTTIAALWVTGHHALVANTGDSRVYRLSGEGLQQLTKDHTALQEWTDAIGPPSDRTAAFLEHVLTQVVGGRRARMPEVRVAELPVSRREVFLLCTDGLFKMVTEPEIAAILSLSASPEQAADALVARANELGGLDNVTVIVVEVEPPSRRERPPESPC